MPSANRYTTTELLAGIRRQGHIPTSQTPFGDSDLLAMADYELQTAILRQIITVRENYYLKSFDTTVNAAVNAYDIPSRAIGGGLADLHWVMGTNITQLVRTELGEQFSTITSPNGMNAFYLQDNQVVVIAPLPSGILRQWYYQRPNTLVPIASASQIVSIASNVITFTALPATFTTAIPYDFIKDQPHFESRAFDQVPTAVTPTTMTFATLPSNLIAGDWVALAGQTPVPQIPVEFRPLLQQRVVVKYYEAQGYLDKMKAAEMKLQAMEKDVFAIINPRVREEPKVISANNGLIGGSLRYRAWSAS